MIASTLLESMAALAVALTVLGTLSAALAASGVASVAAWRLSYSLSETRQIEHLLETTLARTLAVAGSVTSCTADQVVFEGDLDGNGRVDTHSAERTAFVLSARPGGRRALSQRLGQQSITIVDTLAGSARILCFDGNRAATVDALAIRIVEVPIASQSSRTLAVAAGL